MNRRVFGAFACAAALLAAMPSPARAEAKELNVAKQFGLGYLQFIMMDDMKLVEKHAKAAGLGDVKVNWNTFRSSDVMNDALISGTVDFVSLGIPGIATIWAKTKGNMNVKAASGLNVLPLYLNTRNPNVKSIKDFTEKDRIALPAVKVSMQAIMLQMAAAKEFGEANYQKLDSLTVSMAHPDGVAAISSGASEITAHFTSPPFQFRELKNPAIKKLLTSTDILGGKISFNVVATTDKFRTANPKLYGAFLAALQEATDIANKDKRAAAELYLRVTGDKTPIDEMMAMMNDPAIEFTTQPFNTGRMVDFMVKTGSIKVKPADWKDLFFPNMHNYTGG